MKELYEKMGLLYLGKDSEDKNLTLYKSKHLTTHAMLIGMTGSGKTGLGIGLIEEAAIDNIPSIIIDPKGDMGNLCLAFEDLEAKKFEPWLENPQDAQKISDMWKDGLESSFQDISRVNKFASIEKTIYTPGSSAGIGVNILGSFEAPSKEVLEDSDTLSSLINATVSSLLSLISIDADPITSREHLLLSNIFYYYYSKEISLSLEDIIGYVASPPFKKIGMLSLTSFYPQDDRMKLAMALNGIISSVGFSSWIKGEALDIQNMLYDEDGKAKVAIFSIAHLNDNERMFFVTILLNAYINWMRKQRGSSTLKALLYMDEIFGFFPPSKNPPSKEPMLLLLKQARAFGTGVILSTQNPVDLDYKGLSNIGTWFVGKLQTKQDIAKVLDPLSAKSKLSKEEISKKLTTLKGRHFFMKNVHESETIEFSTRWVLSYLKGPMTKDDIKILMEDKKSNHQEKDEVKSIKKDIKGDKKQIISENIKEYFLDTNINSDTPFYPSLYSEVDVRFYNQKRAIDIVNSVELKLELDVSNTTIEWENSLEESCDGFSTTKNSNASYSELPTIITHTKNLREVQKNLSNYLYTSKKLELFSCKQLKLESKLNQTKRDFIVDVEDKLKELREEKVQKLQDRLQTKFSRLEDKLKRLEIKLQKEENDVSAKTSDTLVDVGLALFGAFFGRKALSATTMRKGASAFKKGKGVLKERNDVKNVESLIQDADNDMQELGLKLEEETQKIIDELSIENYEITTFFIKPRRSDIVIKDIALLWER
ncbi:ATP-binding protein [Sulfurimonas sp.]